MMIAVEWDKTVPAGYSNPRAATLNLANLDTYNLSDYVRQALFEAYLPRNDGIVHLIGQIGSVALARQLRSELEQTENNFRLVGQWPWELGYRLNTASSETDFSMYPAVARYVAAAYLAIRNGSKSEKFSLWWQLRIAGRVPSELWWVAQQLENSTHKAQEFGGGQESWYAWVQVAAGVLGTRSRGQAIPNNGPEDQFGRTSQYLRDVGMSGLQKARLMGQLGELRRRFPSSLEVYNFDSSQWTQLLVVWKGSDAAYLGGATTFLVGTDKQGRQRVFMTCPIGQSGRHMVGPVARIPMDWVEGRPQMASQVIGGRDCEIDWLVGLAIPSAKMPFGSRSRSGLSVGFGVKVGLGDGGLVDILDWVRWAVAHVDCSQVQHVEGVISGIKPREVVGSFNRLAITG